PESEESELLRLTIQFLQDTQVGYHAFFAELAQQFDKSWRDDVSQIMSRESFWESEAQYSSLADWRNLYYHLLQNLSVDQLKDMSALLRDKNPQTALLRPVIEAVWEPITQEDNWEPFYELITKLQGKQ
ncbi:MAG: YdiU family protein, partial [Moorea sp. SIO4A3]|nr:YdiU family protein [Moorena sp. SIO4A3]